MINDPASVLDPSLLRAVLAAFPNGWVNVFDRELRSVFTAGRGLAAIGLSPEALSGRTIDDLFDQAAHVKPHCLRGFEGEQAQFELAAFGKTYHISVAPVSELGGRIDHIVVVTQDITERKRRETATRVNEERLRLAFETARLGSWELPLDTWRLETSDGCKATFGRAPDADFTYDDLRAALKPPNDTLIMSAVASAAANRSGFDLECEIVWPDTSEHWVLIRAAFVAGTDHAPDRLIGVTRDVTERQRRMEGLQALDRRKDEFIGVLAHELRQPLAAMTAAVDVLKPRAGEPATRPLGVLERQIAHVRRLLDDLVETSRLVMGRIALEAEPLDLRTVIQSALETVLPDVQARDQRTIVTLPEHPIIVFGDRTRLHQVFSNLVNNASKYGRKGGYVAIAVEIDRESAVVRVRDDGIGIGKEMLPHIFELFAQAPGEARGGMGAGLAVVRSLVGAHGGSVEAQSDGPNHGSEFRVRLPLHRAA